MKKIFEAIKSCVIGFICVIIFFTGVFGVAVLLNKYGVYFLAAIFIYYVGVICWFIGEKIRGISIFELLKKNSSHKPEWDVYS